MNVFIKESIKVGETFINTIDGKPYKAVQKEYEDCDGCAFKGRKDKSCYKAPPCRFKIFVEVTPSHQ